MFNALLLTKGASSSVHALD